MNISILHGRGAAGNPPNRFEALHYEPDPEAVPDSLPPVKTQYLRDDTRSFLTYNDSPDLGFNASANPYRGCEHGCIYCYARPTHEYLGFSSGLDFETKIMVKMNAPELLRDELDRAAWKPQCIAMSGVTDCYQPAERQFKLTRACLEVLAEFRNPVAIVTKSQLVTRDLDVLTKLAEFGGVAVFITITSLDTELASVLEPRAARPSARLAAVRALAEAGIPVGIMVAPVIPILTESEIPTIIAAAAEAGAKFAGYTVLRLPHAVKDLWKEWLQTHYPGKSEAVLSRIRAIRAGKLNDPSFNFRMTGSGVYAEQIRALFEVSCRRHGLNMEKLKLETGRFRRGQEQLSLF